MWGATRSLFEAITAFLIAGMVVLTLLQVITRYGLHSGFEWTEELARVDLIYLTFFGSIVAFLRGEHLRIGTFVDMLRPDARRKVAVLVHVASAAVLAVVVWQGAPLLGRFWLVLSAALGWPTTLFYLPVVIGCSILMICHALEAFALFRGKEERTPSHEVRP